MMDPMTEEAPTPPNRLLTLAEAPRAALELGSLMAAGPLLLAAARGDGHPVLVLPGLSGGPGWTAILRRYLRLVGHTVYGPRFAATKGRHPRVLRLMSERVEELVGPLGHAVDMVAWYDGFTLDPALDEAYADMVALMEKRFYRSSIRYTRDPFTRLRFGAELAKRDLSMRLQRNAILTGTP